MSAGRTSTAQAMALDEGVPRAGLLALASYVVTAIAALPLVVAAPAPLQDWPNHLARVHIMDEMLRGIGPWMAYYDLSSFLLPNAILDLGVLAMLRLGLSQDAAGTVFLLLTYTLFVTGFVRLSASFGAGHAVKPLLAATLFYNVALFWGFVNFVFGLGMLLWVVGLWRAAARTRTRLAIAVLGSAATFICHLIPACLIVGVLGLLDLRTMARAGLLPVRLGLLKHCTSLAAAAVVLLLFAASPTGGDDMSRIEFPPTRSILQFAEWKAALFMKALLRGGIWVDAALGILGAVLLVVTIWSARIRLPRPALLVVAALVLLTLVAPDRIGEGTLFDYRMALVPLVIAAAAAQLSWRHAYGPALVVAAACCLVLARSAALGVAWLDAGRAYAVIDAAFAQLPPGGVVLAARGKSVGEMGLGEFWTPPMSHAAVLATRHGLFVPSVFAYPTLQPLVLAPQFRSYVFPFDADTPEALQRGLKKARALCPGGASGTTFPAVWVAVLYPTALTRQPPFRNVTRRLTLADACLGY